MAQAAVVAEGCGAVQRAACAAGGRAVMAAVAIGGRQ